MSKVQRMPWWWAAGGCAGLVAVTLVVPLGTAGWVAGLAYLVVSSALLTRGLVGAPRFGPANGITATRSALVGIATALAAASFAHAISTPLFVAIASVALALDAVDGYVARRTGTATELGARFDMEVDAFLLLVLSVYDVRYVGAWVLAIGLMRYAFVVVGWMLPWMGALLPARYWRKVVTAVCGIALIVVAAGILPPVLDLAAVAIALALLVESFGRDVIWLARSELTRRRTRVLSKASTDGKAA
ncbi:CDP-alcohol phosphatidyltransferase family protein [Microbacterium sp. ASV49]|uniref:CDP-alcohol phosphatidyltransferase family protein n=1 Tax=Microbacterium candidum TaxID=3041922 RepID=A0ABT7MVB9_9MICO|nr:CDP-alcohol phosphatidyltransferase family protein [Microbacterium sp. ASV49]MDL9978398.1 CDP-alcohol phosphatidyltransferase family protein [Microbacterium sp. ASV49]